MIIVIINKMILRLLEKQISFFIHNESVETISHTTATFTRPDLYLAAVKRIYFFLFAQLLTVQLYF